MADRRFLKRLIKDFDAVKFFLLIEAMLMIVYFLDLRYDFNIPYFSRILTTMIFVFLLSPLSL